MESVLVYRIDLLKQGHTLLLPREDLKRHKKPQKSFKKKRFKADAVQTDISIEEGVKNLVLKAVELGGRIDILVNNAGIFPFSPLATLNAETFDKTIAINLRGLFLTTKYVSEYMIKENIKGKIINTTSIDAVHPSMVGLAHYDASKHGAWGFTKNVALELAKHGITVNAVAPGGVMTPGVAAMQSGGKVTDTERFPDAPKMDVPLGRMGVPDDIGKVVLFLASEMSDYMTGTQIVVDGGYLIN